MGVSASAEDPKEIETSVARAEMSGATRVSRRHPGLRGEPNRRRVQELSRHHHGICGVAKFLEVSSLQMRLVGGRDAIDLEHAHERRVVLVGDSVQRDTAVFMLRKKCLVVMASTAFWMHGARPSRDSLRRPRSWADEGRRPDPDRSGVRIACWKRSRCQVAPRADRVPREIRCPNTLVAEHGESSSRVG
jgi:hypothetical protein